MAKLDALKEKIAKIRATVSEKLAKIPVLKKFVSPTATAAAGSPATPAAAKGKPSPSIGTIYREGGVGTRLHVILMFVLAVCTIFSGFYAGKRLMKRFAKPSQNEGLAEDYSKGLEEMSHKVVENANLVSVGRYTSNAYVGEEQTRMMVVDVWLRVSDPDTASFVDKNDALINDRIAEALLEASKQKINPLTEQGSLSAKSRILEHLNKILPKKGQVQEVFFQNLIVQ